MTVSIRRVKRFAISDPVLLQFFQTGRRMTIEIGLGFPPDAVIVRHFYDREIHAYFVVVQSETFDEVKEGGIIPLGYITIKQISDEAAPISGGANERQGAQALTAGPEGGLRAADQEGTGGETKV